MPVERSTRAECAPAIRTTTRSCSRTSSPLRPERVRVAFSFICTKYMGANVHDWRLEITFRFRMSASAIRLAHRKSRRTRTMNIEFLGPVVGWPLMLLAAWSAGEWLFRRYGFPRVSAYGAVGLLLSGIGLSQGAAPQAALGFLANAALALTLFELGYRVNPRWLGHNPWLLATGIAQALL